MLQDLIAFVEHGTLGELVRENDLLFPFIESVHVLAVCLVVGSIAVVDLRLLGFASVDRPVGRLMRSILPITVGAFGLAVAAGSLLFISHASKYLENRFFIAKITLIALAGVNMAVFHLIGARNLDQWENDALPPLFARVAGGLSLFLWVSVVACGRWIGFTMPPV
ncbi:MAG: DUF6644 family protein [Pseudolabrys sp.]